MCQEPKCETRSDRNDTLEDGVFDELPNLQRGKVRESYDLPDGRRVMIASDRVSAFDRVLAAVPLKGQVLTQIARYWFDETQDICPNHVLSYPDPNVVVAKKLEMLPIEIVVRDYLTGSTGTSIWPMYRDGARVIYGHSFPDGLRKNDKLPKTVITPTTKGLAGAHDEPITAAEIIAQGLLSNALWEEVCAKSFALFARGRDVAASRGLILVDTKFEFGLDEAGQLVIADEILTPDSSRYWRRKSYDARHGEGAEPDHLDKEFLRLWLSKRVDLTGDVVEVPEIPDGVIAELSERYVDLFETVTGRSFQRPDGREHVRARVQSALTATFPEYF
ncbi:MAG: phosphoribosylaminoimidazolesuccinocarboxamide synthase [Pseudomonadota bacterium]